MSRKTLKPFSIYLMENSECWYVGSAWNKTTPQMRYTKHISGRGGATKLWEAIQDGAELTLTILDSGQGETVNDAYVVEELWIHKFLDDDIRESLNINLYPSRRRGWAESPESIERRAANGRGRPNPKNSERLLGQPRPDLVEAWARPGHKEARGLAISAGMAAMTDAAKESMLQKQAEAAIVRWANKQTHCKYGHEFTEENTLYAGTKKARRCRTCEHRRSEEARRRKGVLPLSETHCKNGHLRTDENTYRAPRTGYRQCKDCRREWHAKNAR